MYFLGADYHLYFTGLLPFFNTMVKLVIVAKPWLNCSHFLGGGGGNYKFDYNLINHNQNYD